MATSPTTTTTNQTSATARQVHEDLERMVQTRGHDDTALVKLARTEGERLWRGMKRHPFVSAVGVALGAGALAACVGAAEITFATALAFAAYKVLREGEPPDRGARGD